jgi:hypothetical protein
MSKLPVFELISYVVSSTLKNAGYAMAISWPWLVVLFPLRLAVEIHKFYYGFTPIANYNGVQYDWPGLIVAIISFFAFSSIAVNWHRYILNGENAVGW